jgi:hypothetical protein
MPHSNGSSLEGTFNPLQNKLMRRSRTFERLKRYQKERQASLVNLKAEENEIIKGSEYGIAFGVKRGACCIPCKCVRYNPKEPNGLCTCSHWPGK